MPRTAPAAITFTSAALAGRAVTKAASSSPMRNTDIRIMLRSGVADFARQHAGADADLFHRTVVLRADVRAENQVGVRAAMQPAVLLHFGLELARRPARIAEREDRACWPVTARDRLEYVEGGGEADAFI